jgi:predicted alpha/beta hydrolase family esterase
MKNAIILHGCPQRHEYYDPKLPSESNAHWLPWLQKELLIRDIKADTPEVPQSYEPEWDIWCREVERFDIGPDTMLVGHSCGGGFWLRYLSEHQDLRVGKVVLVAPWLDPDHTLREDFFKFEWDHEIANRAAGLTIFYSDDDSETVHRSIARIRQELNGVNWRMLPGYGHFTYDNLGGVVFPELRDELIGSSVQM